MVTPTAPPAIGNLGLLGDTRTAALVDTGGRVFAIYLTEVLLLVMAVVFLFLQSVRAVLIPATTVPVTIIGAFIAMAGLGFFILDENDGDDFFFLGGQLLGNVGIWYFFD